MAYAVPRPRPCSQGLWLFSIYKIRLLSQSHDDCFPSSAFLAWFCSFVELPSCRPLVHPVRSSGSLAAQWHRVLAGTGEEPQRLPGGSVVSVVEDHGLLDGKEGDGPVPYFGAWAPRQQLAHHSRSHLLSSVRALPLQGQDLTKPE